MKVYKCFDCSEVFDKKFELYEHKNIHSGETPFMCSNCKKCFSLVKEYVSHIKSRHLAQDKSVGEREDENDSKKKCLLETEEIFDGLKRENGDCDCPKCCASFEPSKNSESHLDLKWSHEKLNNLQAEKSEPSCSCCSCQISFNTVIKNKKLTNFVCQNCNKNFSTSDSLAKHVCFFLSGGVSLQCSCSQTFKELSGFKTHIGSKPYSCCRCHMQFNTFTNLIRHIRTHTKQKPYICKDCGRGFSQSAHLRNHLSIHLGISAVKCSECNFSCKTFNGLLKHKKKHKEGLLNHQNYIDGRKKSANPSTCPVCSKEFLFKRNMGMHMKIHSNKTSLCTECGKVFDSKGKLTSHHKACHREPSVCKTCGKVFASAVLLGAHEKIHVSDKLFSCNVCHKTFSIKNYLVQHMKTHSNKKKFSCSKCGKLFKVAVSLKYHSNICASLSVPV